MKCFSCNVEIPVSFVAALAANTCPGCSGPIQTEESIEFMDELSEAFERMPNDPQGIAGWILSNYRLNKIGDEAPPEQFHRPLTDEEKAAQQQAAQQAGGIKIAPNPVDEFLSRTSHSDNASSERQNKLKEMARNIKSGNADEAMYGGMDTQMSDEERMVSEDDASDMNFVNMGGVVKQSGVAAPQTAVQAMIPANNGFPSQEGSITQEEIVMAQKLVEQSFGDDLYPIPEDARAAKVIQNQRLKRIKTQQAFEAGGSFKTGK